MEFFKRWNNLTGWAVFVIAALVYLLTMEPSSSLWDCSEFIATSYKLEVGHLSLIHISEPTRPY